MCYKGEVGRKMVVVVGEMQVSACTAMQVVFWANGEVDGLRTPPPLSPGVGLLLQNLHKPEPQP